MLPSLRPASKTNFGHKESSRLFGDNLISSARSSPLKVSHHGRFDGPPKKSTDASNLLASRRSSRPSSMASLPSPRKTSLPESPMTELPFSAADRAISRRNSLPNTLEKVDVPEMLNFHGSGQLLNKRGNSSRRKSIDSADRDLHCMVRNTVEERRLQVRVQELERTSFAGTLERRQQKNEVLKHFQNISQRSPTAQEWLDMRKSRTSSWQKRERDDIAKRYSRRLRQFRAPPHLQSTVAKVRTYTLLEAGFLQYVPKDKEPSVVPEEDEAVTKMTSLKIARRHTLSGDAIASQLPPQLSTTEGPKPQRFERRMTMGDIQIIKNVLDSRANDDLAELHDEEDEDEIKDENEMRSVNPSTAEGISENGEEELKDDDGNENEKVEETHSSDEFDTDVDEDNWDAL